MKKKITLAAILLMAMAAHAQLYYGSALGVNIGAAYDGQRKAMRVGVNDIIWAVPVGYAIRVHPDQSVLLEAAPSMAISMTAQLNMSIGYDIDISEKAGVHMMGGYAYNNLEDLPFKQSLYWTGTLRFWVGHTLFQGTFINNSWQVTLGIIGLGIK
jgi:hypothetical protein